MIRHGLAVLTLCLTLVLPAWADQLIVEPDMGIAPVKNAILSAEHSLDLIMYGFTDDTLLNALISQQRRGRTVKVILEQSPYKAEKENTKVINAFKTNQVPWQGSLPGFQLIHQKMLIMDGEKAMVMTFNFTRATFKNERNFALVIDNVERVHNLLAMFSADWNRVPIHNRDDHLIYSPDNSRESLLALINHAKHTILLYTQTLSDYKIAGALANAARKGVQVNILTSAKLRDKQANYLQRAGVMVHISKQYYIHAKVFIIDNKQAVIGSINLTRASLDTNRELSVITDDPAVIKQLNAVFNKDWQATESTALRRIKTPTLNHHMLTQAARVVRQTLKALVNNSALRH